MPDSADNKHARILQIQLYDVKTFTKILFSGSVCFKLSWLIKIVVFSGIGIVTVVSMYLSTRKMKRCKDLSAKVVTVVVGLAVVGVNLHQSITALKCK